MSTNRSLRRRFNNRKGWEAGRAGTKLLWAVFVAHVSASWGWQDSSLWIMRSMAALGGRT